MALQLVSMSFFLKTLKTLVNLLISLLTVIQSMNYKQQLAFPSTIMIYTHMSYQRTHISPSLSITLYQMNTSRLLTIIKYVFSDSLNPPMQQTLSVSFAISLKLTTPIFLLDKTSFPFQLILFLPLPQANKQPPLNNNSMKLNILWTKDPSMLHLSKTPEKNIPLIELSSFQDLKTMKTSM